MIKFYQISEWEQYQHYKKRNPPWIKLHKEILTSETWLTLDDASRVLAIACMLVASDTENRIPANPAFLRRRAYLNTAPDFTPLLCNGFLQAIDSEGEIITEISDASKVLASARPEAEAEAEAEAEIRSGAEFSLPASSTVVGGDF